MGGAHSFMVMREQAGFAYKISDDWQPAHERSLRWDEPSAGTACPLSTQTALVGCPARCHSALGICQQALLRWMPRHLPV
jgi:hypothetical protein